MQRPTSLPVGGTIELRELRVFLALAEELHFGRTAQRLGLTPSRVSQSLRELESKLGGQLLHRTSRRVTLTPFGERFLADATPAYQQLADVLARARVANDRLEGTLELGLLFPTAGGSHLTAIIQAFEEHHPGCDVQLRMFDDPLGPLRSGDVDLLATRLPVDRPDIAVGPTLSREPRVLQVARDHPLAARDRVSIEDIADYHVMPLDGFPGETIDAIIPRTTPLGRPVRRRRLRLTPRTPFEVEALVARGVIVHPTVPSYADYFRHPDVVHVPIHDMPPVTTGLVWRRGSSDPRLHEFVRFTRDVIAGRQPV